MADVNIPGLGPTPKGAVIGIVVVSGGIGGYILWKSAKKKKAAAVAAASASTTAKTGYGYGTQGYGYGSSVPYGSSGYGYGAYGEFTPYPVEEAYGYGQYGYGYYNPITGQYYGPATDNGSGTGEGTTPSTNAQWTQDAISILSSEGYNSVTVQTALGAWLNNQQITNNQEQIVSAAIGALGEPPDPPSSTNTSPASGQSGSGGTVTVPNVKGQPAMTALSTLKSAGLVGHIGSGFDSNERNIVGSQTPAAGSKIASGSTVDIGGFTH